MAGGWARPLAGDDGAFTACEIWLRRGAETERAVVPVSVLARFAASREVGTAAALDQVLANLAAPPTSPALPNGQAPLIMGVVNVTPDSFSDGGRFFVAEDAIAQARRLWSEGAAIIDVGGESTRPGASPVPVGEEIRRVVPVVQALEGEGIFVSIDSRKATVMAAAIEAGARMINDVSAFSHDADSLGVAAASGLPMVLMHSRGEPATMQQNPVYAQVVLDVYDALEARVQACLAAGVARERLLIDPGIGFGKTLAHNLGLLRDLGLYRCMGLPVVLGVSRKAFIGRLADDATVDQRLPGSLAAALAGAANGASIIRVHDVRATRQALCVWRATAAGAAGAAAC